MLALRMALPCPSKAGWYLGRVIPFASSLRGTPRRVGCLRAGGTQRRSLSRQAELEGEGIDTVISTHGEPLWYGIAGEL
jgi:hypothetical protein